METIFVKEILKTLEMETEEQAEKVMPAIAEELGVKLGEKCIVNYNEKQGYIAEITTKGIIPMFDPERENPIIILAKVITGHYQIRPSGL